MMSAVRAGITLALLLLVAPVTAAANDAATLLEGAIGRHSLVLLGEMHGTQEIPAITGELVAHYARTQPVLLALEADAGDQLRLDRFLASDGGVTARAALLAGDHWQEPNHDGRDSAAMFALIEQVRQLRKAGASVDVVLIDAAGAGTRDERMAAAVRTAMAAHPGARALVLIGNVHAMTGEPPEMIADGKPFVPPRTVARYRVDLRPFSVVFRAAGGTFWTCRGGRCGEHDVLANPTGESLPRIEHHAPEDPWMLTMLLPRFTASPPAIRAETPRLR